MIDHQRHLLRLCILLIVILGPALGATSCGFANGAAKGKPNILFIAVDDLRPDLGCYGNQQVFTPNIDRFASSAVVFKSAYCQQAVCNPSRSSLMTGMRPDTIGVTGNHIHFRSNKPNVVTLPEHFKNNGYHAAAIGKLYHGVFPDGASNTKWDTMGDPQSWSEPAVRFGPRYYYTEDGIEDAKKVFLKIYKPKNPEPDDWTEKLVFGPATESPDVPDNTLYDGKVAEAAVAKLGELKQRDQPFFLAVGFIKPHSPYIAPKKYFDLYENVPVAENQNLPLNAPSFAGHRSGELRRYTDQPARGPISDENQRRVRHAYYACTSFIDVQVGQILTELQRLGLAENTIVCLYGDHGYHLGEHGLWGKTTNFELDTRVPLVVRAPGMKALGKTCSSLVELVDLYPTLADLAGLPLHENLEGESFSAMLDDVNATTKQFALSQYPRGKTLMGYSMRTASHRLTRWVDRKSKEVQATELYDYADSSIEKENIAAAKNSESLLASLNQKFDRVFASSLRASKAKTSQGKLKLSRAFGDHMVVQANQPIRIWGDAKPFDRVTVSFLEKSQSSVADEAGNWEIELSAHNEYVKTGQNLIVTTDSDRLALNDVLVGEVWICAGQSNMEWELRKSTNGKEAVANSNNFLLRLHNCPGGARGSGGTYNEKQMKRLLPTEFSKGRWKVASPESSASFSAVGYFFAQRICEKLDAPVGIINVSVGGTPIEAWVSAERLKSDRNLAKLFDGNWLDNPMLDQWCRGRARENLQRALKGELTVTGDEFGPNHSFKPGFMFDAGIKPFAPLSIRGGLWYQGESNADNPERTKTYQACFPLLLDDWREHFQKEKLPVYFVQLPAMGRPNWPVFREYQRRSLAGLTNVGMAITIDTGHPTNVHPADKRPVGHRLAQLALVNTYGHSGLATGPLLKTASVVGNSMEISFDFVGEGLTTADGMSPNQFEVAGKDGKFHPADAKIIGAKIKLTSRNVSNPVHARYAWADYPKPAPNLINSEGLPASPFTTQDVFH